MSPEATPGVIDANKDTPVEDALFKKLKDDATDFESFRTYIDSKVARALAPMQWPLGMQTIDKEKIVAHMENQILALRGVASFAKTQPRLAYYTAVLGFLLTKLATGSERDDDAAAGGKLPSIADVAAQTIPDLRADVAALRAAESPTSPLLLARNIALTMNMVLEISRAVTEAAGLAMLQGLFSGTSSNAYNIVRHLYQNVASGTGGFKLKGTHPLTRSSVETTLLAVQLASAANVVLAAAANANKLLFANTGSGNRAFALMLLFFTPFALTDKNSENVAWIDASRRIPPTKTTTTFFRLLGRRPGAIDPTTGTQRYLRSAAVLGVAELAPYLHALSSTHLHIAGSARELGARGDFTAFADLVLGQTQHLPVRAREAIVVAGVDAALGTASTSAAAREFLARTAADARGIAPLVPVTLKLRSAVARRLMHAATVRSASNHDEASSSSSSESESDSDDERMPASRGMRSASDADDDDNIVVHTDGLLDRFKDRVFTKDAGLEKKRAAEEKKRKELEADLAVQKAIRDDGSRSPPSKNAAKKQITELGKRIEAVSKRIDEIDAEKARRAAKSKAPAAVRAAPPLHELVANAASNSNEFAQELMLLDDFFTNMEPGTRVHNYIVHSADGSLACRVFTADGAAQLYVGDVPSPDPWLICARAQVPCDEHRVAGVRARRLRRRRAACALCQRRDGVLGADERGGAGHEWRDCRDYCSSCRSGGRERRGRRRQGRGCRGCAAEHERGR